MSCFHGWFWGSRGGEGVEGGGGNIYCYHLYSTCTVLAVTQTQLSSHSLSPSRYCKIF